jgi:DNA-binding FadR family transcriptional regulator
MTSTAPKLTESIAARLRNEILVGTYKAGERLPAERDLASRLGVNRGSVREALKKLEQMGLVVIRRGDGATVRHLHDASIEIVRHLLIVNGVVNRRLLEQVLDVQEMLIAGAAHLAVERGSPEDHQRARELLWRLLEPGVSNAERPALFDALVDVIAEASGNLVVRLVRNVIRPALAEQLHAMQRQLADDSHELDTRVRAIDVAIEAGDAAATAAAVRALLRERRKRMLRALDALESERAPGAAQAPDAATGSA